MSILRTMIDRWRGRKRSQPGIGVGMTKEQAAGPPVIETQFGPVTESARHCAALNMREDPLLREKVEQLLANQLFGGDLACGKVESKRRYPEAYT